MKLLVKLGGTLLDSGDSRDALARQIAAVRAAGHQVTVVHGGGRQMTRYLADRGYACLHWPLEFGGAAASVAYQAVFAEECARAGVPRQLNITGADLVGPVLIKFGSPEQKDRYLEPIRLGDDVWCQLFSEPGAGSDLAGVRTRAERTDTGWRVGAPVRVEIAPRSLKKVVTVPRDAVIYRQGASYVMRVRPDNTAERVAVNIGPGQAAFLHRAEMNGLARSGTYSSDAEKAAS